MRRAVALVIATGLSLALSSVPLHADEEVVLSGTVRNGSAPVRTRVRVYRLRSALEGLWPASPDSTTPAEFPELWFSGVFELFYPADRTRNEVAVTESDGSGAFEVRGVAPGHFECEAQTPDGGVAISEAIQQEAGVHTVELDLATDVWPVVRGQVLEHDGRPFKGQVLAWHSGLPPVTKGVSVPTDAAGRFEIRVPKRTPLGVAGLAAIEQGHRVIRWKLTPDRTAGVTYVGGGHGRLPVVVRAAGTGAPIPGARVLRATRLTLPGEREREVFELATTDADGHAWMGRPPPTGTTSYAVIQAPGFQRTIDAVEATEDRVEFTLASSVRVTGRLDGHVPHDASDWLATLWFWPSTWYIPIWRTAPVRQDGTFDLGDVPGAPNHAIVGVRGPGFVGVQCLDARLDALVRLPAWLVSPIWQAPLEASEWPRCPEYEREAHRELVVPIEPTTRLRVAVRDASGTPLVGARLRLECRARRDERPLAATASWFSKRGPGDSQDRLVPARTGGIAEFGELIVGEFVTVSVEWDDHQLVELGEVRIRSGGVHTVQFTLPYSKD
ncbi:MAG: hypothetical protein AB7T63_15805 [Planctomycetota bacterium]